MAGTAQRHATVLDPESLHLAGLYAQALLDLVPGHDDAEDVADELAQLARLDRDPDLHNLLTSGFLSTGEREQLVGRVFRGRVRDVTADFLGVLARRNRLGLLRWLPAEFRRRLDDREGKVPILLTTAVPLADEVVESLTRDMTEMFGGPPALEIRVDPEIIGGIVFRVGDRVLDASVSAKLHRLRRQLAHPAGGVPWRTESTPGGPAEADPDGATSD